MRRSNGWEFPDAKILVIDDGEQNLKLANQVLQMAGYVDIKLIQDPRQAVEAILSEGTDLVLLDVHMPYMDGYEVLERSMKKLGADAFVPILMCTSDNSLEARQKALKLGAYDFIAKPYEKTEMLLRVRNFLRMRSMHLSIQHASATFEHRVKVRTRELLESRSEALDCLTRALGYRDDAVGGQAKRVANISERIARAYGLEEAEVEMIGLIAPLQDLGKVGLPHALLAKLESHAEEDLPEMQRHTLLGETIIGDCNSPILREVKELALHHHEKWDGTGYPHGLKGEEIPVTCRIVALANTFDAMTTSRYDRPALTRQDAIAEIRTMRGAHFDPAVVDAFLRIYA